MKSSGCMDHFWCDSSKWDTPLAEDQFIQGYATPFHQSVLCKVCPNPVFCSWLGILEESGLCVFDCHGRKRDSTCNQTPIAGFTSKCSPNRAILYRLNFYFYSFTKYKNFEILLFFIKLVQFILLSIYHFLSRPLKWN